MLIGHPVNDFLHSSSQLTCQRPIVNILSISIFKLPTQCYKCRAHCILTGFWWNLSCLHLSQLALYYHTVRIMNCEWSATCITRSSTSFWCMSGLVFPFTLFWQGQLLDIARPLAKVLLPVLRCLVSSPRPLVPSPCLACPLLEALQIEAQRNCVTSTSWAAPPSCFECFDIITLDNLSQRCSVLYYPCALFVELWLWWSWPWCCTLVYLAEPVSSSNVIHMLQANTVENEFVRSDWKRRTQALDCWKLSRFDWHRAVGRPSHRTAQWSTCQNCPPITKTCS